MFCLIDLLFNFLQSFLCNGYKEFSIFVSESGDFCIELNVLYIWLYGKFMMIVLFNLDCSFIVMMFYFFDGFVGFNIFNMLEKVEGFFEIYYFDVLLYLLDLKMEYFENLSFVLGMIKCYLWEVYKKILLMGDVVYVIVLFYG